MASCFAATSGRMALTPFSQYLSISVPTYSTSFTTCRLLAIWASLGRTTGCGDAFTGPAFTGPCEGTSRLVMFANAARRLGHFQQALFNQLMFLLNHFAGLDWTFSVLSPYPALVTGGLPLPPITPRVTPSHVPFLPAVI